MNRQDVYDIIDSERDYQEQKFGNSKSSSRKGSGERTLDEFALYIRGYAEDLAYIGSHSTSKSNKIDAVRKIAGLCVQCLEQHVDDKESAKRK